MVNWFMRVCMVLFWICIIAVFLLVPPYYVRLFNTRSLNIFTWSGLLDVAYLADFEKKTGIKLNISYYESNEELLSKLSATKGAGYDLIVPSDYTVYRLIRQDLLKPLDKDRLPLLKKIDKKLLNNYFDPENRYSLPYFWGVYGVGINMEYYKEVNKPKRALDYIFLPALLSHMVTMPGNAREVISLAAHYLFGDVGALHDFQKREQLKQFLVQQKKYVFSYTDERAISTILSHSSSAILAQWPDIWRAQRENTAIQLVIPDEDVFVVIDNFVIPKSTYKENMIYEFLNYIYSDDAIMHHSVKFGMCPPTTVSISSELDVICADLIQNKKLLFFEPQVSEEVLSEIWMALMAA